MGDLSDHSPTAAYVEGDAKEFYSRTIPGWVVAKPELRQYMEAYTPVLQAAATDNRAFLGSLKELMFEVASKLRDH